MGEQKCWRTPTARGLPQRNWKAGLQTRWRQKRWTLGCGGCSCHYFDPCSGIFLDLPVNNTSRAYNEHTWPFFYIYNTAGREPTYYGVAERLRLTARGISKLMGLTRAHLQNCRQAAGLCPFASRGLKGSWTAWMVSKWRLDSKQHSRHTRHFNFHFAPKTSTSHHIPDEALGSA